ncbi:MAG: 3-isopropylmalate dehydratase small subunit [Vicinamibacterales bacterium]
MQPFRTHTGLVAPLPRPDIDTDQIIPKQFLKRLGRTGFEDALFYDWRVDRAGVPRADFVLNDARYAGASVLLAGQNFGCGSSREHAVWALHDYGFRVVLAPSFADIFAGNAVANGLLAAVVDAATLAALQHAAEAGTGYRVTVDLERRRVTGDGVDAAFAIDERARTRLLDGLDDISLILRHERAIKAFEDAHAR